jgi:hypothetical protein
MLMVNLDHSGVVGDYPMTESLATPARLEALLSSDGVC